MTQIPQRPSLVAQVADIVRREIKNGEWGEFLPGELELCSRLKVSRPTLRSALETLRRDGLIEVSQGRRRRIVARDRARVTSRESKIVGVIASIPYHTLSAFSLFLLNELQTHLHDAGYKLEVHANARFSHANPTRALESLSEQLQPAGWVLIGPTKGVQRWFFARQHPVLVLGGTDKGFELPCLGVDYRAVTRHAVGMYLNRGHHRVGLMIPEGPEEIGENPTKQGFLEGFSRAEGSTAYQPHIVAHNATVEGIRAALNTAMKSNAPPTGLLISRPKHVLTAMSHLMNSGIRIPDDMSIISLGNDPVLDEMTPRIARYVINWDAYARRAARLTIQMVTQGALPPRQILLMSQFQDGATLKSLAAS